MSSALRAGETRILPGRVATPFFGFFRASVVAVRDLCFPPGWGRVTVAA